MNQTIEQRMLNIDIQLKELRKELKAEREEALANPNTIPVEDAFKYMFDKYENALEELAEK